MESRNKCLDTTETSKHIKLMKWLIHKAVSFSTYFHKNSFISNSLRAMELDRQLEVQVVQ